MYGSTRVGMRGIEVSVSQRRLVAIRSYVILTGQARRCSLMTTKGRINALAAGA